MSRENNRFSIRRVFTAWWKILSMVQLRTVLVVLVLFTAFLVMDFLIIFLDAPEPGYIWKRWLRTTGSSLPSLVLLLPAAILGLATLYLVLSVLQTRGRNILTVVVYIIGLFAIFIYGGVYYTMRIIPTLELTFYTLAYAGTLGPESGSLFADVHWLIYAHGLIFLAVFAFFFYRLQGPMKDREFGLHHKIRGPVFSSVPAISLAIIFYFVSAIFSDSDAFLSSNEPALPVEYEAYFEFDAASGEIPPEGFTEPMLESLSQYFYGQHGFNLRKGDDIVLFIIEGSRKEYTEFSRSRYFSDEWRTLYADNFYVPIPHSSNTHFSHLTGKHSSRRARRTFDVIDRDLSLPGVLQKHGYRTVYIYGDDTSFDREDQMLEKLNMEVIERDDIEEAGNPETGLPYQHSFDWGVDDIALYHQARAILAQSEEPVFLVIVYTNSHVPYFNPRPEQFNRFDNTTNRGRHRNAVDYQIHISDKIMAAFEEKDRRALFIMTADHGESFGEYGFVMHDFSLYNTEVRVPFAMYHSHFEAIRENRNFAFGTALDIMPTIFDLFSIEVEGQIHGQSLFSTYYRETLLLRAWGSDDYRGLVLSPYKWIYKRPEDLLLRMTVEDEQITEIPIDEDARRFIRELYQSGP